MVFASKHEPRPCYEPVLHLNGHWSGGCCHEDYMLLSLLTCIDSILRQVHCVHSLPPLFIVSFHNNSFLFGVRTEYPMVNEKFR